MPHEAHAGSPAEVGGLGALVTSLLEDPAVLQQIQQDPELRERWSDPALRQHVAQVPAHLAAMEKLMELARTLVSDPAVQQRIQADSVLRALWAAPAVRERIGGVPHH